MRRAHASLRAHVQQACSMAQVRAGMHVVQPAPACAGIGGACSSALDGSARLSSLPSFHSSLPLLLSLRVLHQPRQQTCSRQHTPLAICHATRRKGTVSKPADDAVSTAPLAASWHHQGGLQMWCMFAPCMSGLTNRAK